MLYTGNFYNIVYQLYLTKKKENEHYECAVWL